VAFALGYHPDKPDDRDQSADELLAAAVSVPDEGSLAKYVIRVLNQANIGSCVANAGSQGVRMSQVRQMMAAGVEKPSPPLASRLFGYFNARAYHEATAIDDGTFIRYFFKSLNKYGFCPESEWPYDTSRFAELPDQSVYRRAFDQKDPTDYYRITGSGEDRLSAIRKAISLGHPVVFGTIVSKDFTMGRGVRDLIGPTLDADQHAGGHAMLVEGYSPGGFTILNSWGDGFADHGRVRFSEDYMAWENTTDLWVVRSAPSYSDLPRSA